MGVIVRVTCSHLGGVDTRLKDQRDRYTTHATYGDLVDSDLERQELLSHHLAHLSVDQLVFGIKTNTQAHLDHSLLTSSIGELSPTSRLEQTRDTGGCDNLTRISFGTLCTGAQQREECGGDKLDRVSQPNRRWREDSRSWRPSWSEEWYSTPRTQI